MRKLDLGVVRWINFKKLKLRWAYIALINKLGRIYFFSKFLGERMKSKFILSILFLIYTDYVFSEEVELPLNLVPQKISQPEQIAKKAGAFCAAKGKREEQVECLNRFALALLQEDRFLEITVQKKVKDIFGYVGDVSSSGENRLPSRYSLVKNSFVLEFPFFENEFGFSSCYPGPESENLDQKQTELAVRAIMSAAQFIAGYHTDMMGKRLYFFPFSFNKVVLCDQELMKRKILLDKRVLYLGVDWQNGEIRPFSQTESDLEDILGQSYLQTNEIRSLWNSGIQIHPDEKKAIEILQDDSLLETILAMYFHVQGALHPEKPVDQNILRLVSFRMWTFLNPVGSTLFHIKNAVIHVFRFFVKRLDFFKFDFNVQNQDLRNKVELLLNRLELPNDLKMQILTMSDDAEKLKAYRWKVLDKLSSPDFLIFSILAVSQNNSNKSCGFNIKLNRTTSNIDPAVLEKLETIAAMGTIEGGQKLDVQNLIDALANSLEERPFFNFRNAKVISVDAQMLGASFSHYSHAVEQGQTEMPDQCPPKTVEINDFDLSGTFNFNLFDYVDVNTDFSPEHLKQLLILAMQESLY